MCLRVSRPMRCDPAMVGVARAWVEGHLAAMYDGLGDTGEDAALVVSELATNCVQAGAAWLRLTLVGHRGTVHVEATDDGPGWPQMSAVRSLDQARGRGLRIVEALSIAWGARAETVGKTVWADLAVAARTQPLFTCRLEGFDGHRLTDYR
jgi:anti-sigma regulatory factor (Ser/Thr protein kinase)